MGNREKRIEQPSVHILMALARPSQGSKSACIRTVDKGRGDEIDILEAKLKVMGGYWRIHRTVNARDCSKALKWLMCRLINHPEKACYIDSEWRTALLQKECIYGQGKFMLDVDTQDEVRIQEIEKLVPDILEKIKTPKGWHYITKPFDTRDVCKFPDVTLLRDGYVFIKEVGKVSDEITMV
jgi:hypothetical protein